MKIAVGMTVAAACVIAGCGGSVDPSAATDARALMEQADEAMLTADAAYQQGDQATWTSSRDEASRLYRDAALHFRAAGYDSSNNASFLQEYAETVSKSRDYDLAAQAYAACIASNPEDPAWYLEAGHALRRLGGDAISKAIENYTIALSLPDASSQQRDEAHTALAELYWRAQQYEHARAVCEQIESPNFSALTVLAGCDLRDGDVQTAFEALNNLEQVSPDEQTQLRSRIGSAIDDMRQRKIAFPDNAKNHFAFAQLSLVAGRGQDALLAASRAAQLADEDIDILNLAGTLEAQSGNLAAALALFERSFEIDPDQAQVGDAITQLRAALSQQ